MATSPRFKIPHFDDHNSNAARGENWREIDRQFNETTLWNNWTPTIAAGSGTLTTTSSSCYYMRVNEVLIWYAQITITTNGTGGTYVSFTLPPGQATAQSMIGYGRAGAVSGKQLQVTVLSSTVGAIENYDGSYPAADGEILLCQGQYRIA